MKLVSRVCLVASFVLTASSAAADPRFSVMSECRQYPDFDPAAVTHNDFGPSVYGTWSYDLIFRNIQTVIVEDAFGRLQCSQPMTRSQLMTQRFEISEQYGRPEDIKRAVLAWLAARSIERCGP